MVRFVSFLLLGIVLLTACGGQGTTTGSTASTPVPPVATSAAAETTPPPAAPTTAAAPATSAPATDTPATAAPATAAAEATTAAATTPESQATTAAAATSAAADGVFPVTIAHKFGSTTIEKEPKRIVTVGLTDQDALLALGIAPVGVTEWFGKQPYATWPWARAKLGDAKPEMVGDGQGPKFETIAALKPDVILALYSGVTQEQYALLSKIAPTVAQPAGLVDYGISWQESTRTIGKVVGKAAQAETLVAGVEAQFKAVRDAHPDFAKASAVVATPYQGIYVYGKEDVRGRLLTSLGFKLPEGLDQITGSQFGGNLSMERADLLNVDVIIWLDPTSATGPLGGPVYQGLKVHKEGREVFLESFTDPLGAATSFVTVLSIPYLLDGLVPRLDAALDGDPSTSITSVPAAATSTAAPAPDTTATATAP